MDMSQPNSAEENNNLRYVGIFIVLLALAGLSYLLYPSFQHKEEKPETSTKQTVKEVMESRQEVIQQEEKDRTITKNEPDPNPTAMGAKETSSNLPDLLIITCVVICWLFVRA